MTIYNVLSLFSGMGGMDMGFGENVIVHNESVLDKTWTDEELQNPLGFVQLKKLPFSVVFQNDISKIAQKIMMANGWDRNFHSKDIVSMLDDTTQLFPQAHVVIGGFPCQDFSHSGKRAGFNTSRGVLYKSFVTVVERVKPLVFVAENVHGLLTMPTKPLEIIKQDFENLGYIVRHQLVKCEEFGIPQKRWRVIIIGIRCDKSSNIVVDELWNIIQENKISCCCQKYLQHLLEPGETTDDAQKIFSKAKELPKGQGQIEINLQSFCPTIRSEHHGNIEFRRKNNGINKDEHALPQRRLTVRETALLQTFPPNCILTDERRSMTSYKAIGNAVPPLLSYLIARKTLELLQKMESS